METQNNVCEVPGMKAKVFLGIVMTSQRLIFLLVMSACLYYLCSSDWCFFSYMKDPKTLQLCGPYKLQEKFMFQSLTLYFWVYINNESHQNRRNRMFPGLFLIFWNTIHFLGWRRSAPKLFLHRLSWLILRIVKFVFQFTICVSNKRVKGLLKPGERTKYQGRSTTLIVFAFTQIVEPAAKVKQRFILLSTFLFWLGLSPRYFIVAFVE